MFRYRLMLPTRPIEQSGHMLKESTGHSAGMNHLSLHRGAEPFYVHGFDGDNESTSWEFSRRVKEKTLKSEYTFDVEKTANSVVMSVMGDCKAG